MFPSAKLSKMKQYRMTLFHLFSPNNDIVVTLSKIISVRGGNKSKIRPKKYDKTMERAPISPNLTKINTINKVNKSIIRIFADDK